MRATRLFALGLLAASASCTSTEQSVTGPSAARCSLNLTNSMDTAAAVGGSGTLSIELARDCAWTASSGAAWVVITSASNGQGGAMIAYRVGVNAGPQRTGSLSLLGDQIFWVIQKPSRRPVLKDFLAL